MVQMFIFVVILEIHDPVVNIFFFTFFLRFLITIQLDLEYHLFLFQMVFH